MWLQAGSRFTGRGVAGEPPEETDYVEDFFVAENGTPLTEFNPAWVNNFGSFVINGNNLYAAAGGQISVAHRTENVSPNQFVYVTIGDYGAAGAIGVAARCAAGASATAYVFYAEQFVRYLFKYVAGNFTLLDSEIAATTTGDELGLEIVGNILRPKVNGDLWSKGEIEDNSIASGHIGVAGRNDAGTTNFGSDSWYGGKMGDPEE